MMHSLTIKEVQIQFGNWCKSLRKTEGLTQAELGEKLVMSRLTISKLERGDNFTIDSLLKILQYFGKLQSLADFVKNQADIPKSLY